MGEWRECPDCNGTGYDFGDGGQCDRCGGMGEYYDEFYDPDDDNWLERIIIMDGKKIMRIIGLVCDVVKTVAQIVGIIFFGGRRAAS